MHALDQTTAPELPSDPCASPCASRESAFSRHGHAHVTEHFLKTCKVSTCQRTQTEIRRQHACDVDVSCRQGGRLGKRKSLHIARFRHRPASVPNQAPPCVRPRLVARARARQGGAGTCARERLIIFIRIPQKSHHRCANCASGVPLFASPCNDFIFRI
jgi:hypothetical protein